MKSKINRLLNTSIIKAIICLVAFFSLGINVNAASFAYNAFDWDKFYEENVDYWTDYCESESSGDQQECLEIVLSGKKQFYVKLYKLLAKYEKKGYKLDDNIILATSFYGLTPDTFTDLPEEYRKEYRDGSAYNIDLNENLDSYDVDTDESAEYYNNETDSLKTLIKHMFAYKADCNGIVATPEVDQNGNYVCHQGRLSGDSCVDLIKNFNLTYTEHLIVKWRWVTKLLGISTEKVQECESLGGKMTTSNKKEINYDVYWEFLTKSTYFDNKIHLNSYYSTVLEKMGHKYMRDVTDDEKEMYKDELIEIRERIVREIKSVLSTYGTFADTPDSYVDAVSTVNSAWWPIGSDEVTEENGVIFAKESPTSTNIVRPFGSTTGEGVSSGIDIANVVDSVTNVIAIKDGVVVYPNSDSDINCPSSSTADSCGSGYGNYVVIQHNDGTFSLYAHLSPGSISLRANDSVKKGQVIGKTGSSGAATEPLLHFEIRQGANSSTSAVDPMNYVSVDNPRSSSGSSDFVTFLRSWENAGGAPENNGNYVVHNDGANIPTVGYGIALKYNIDRFKRRGIDVTGLTFGDELPKDVVDDVEMEFINEAFTNVRNVLAQNGISLAEYQVEALVSRYFNCGNISGFPSKYLEYGDTDALYNNYMNKPVTGQGVGYLPGLERRRKAEWQLFHYQNYELNA